MRLLCCPTVLPTFVIGAVHLFARSFVNVCMSICYERAAGSGNACVRALLMLVYQRRFSTFLCVIFAARRRTTICSRASQIAAAAAAVQARQTL